MAVTRPGDGPLDGGLTEDDAEAHVHGICFKTGPPRCIGVELEWLVRDVRDPALPIPADRIFAAVADLTAPAVLPQPAVLPSGSLITVEPGGQLELSSAPADSLGGCVTAVQRDMTALRDAIRRAGLALQGYGFDPLRPPRRVLDLPRYAAMEEFFDRDGPWGRQMMCSTASVQVCVDAGLDEAGARGYRRRWRLAHDIGPVLVAAFANSPLRQGQPSGWRSTRQEVWSRLDPGRTLPPPADADPRCAWANYSLDAELMLVRRAGSPSWTAPPGLTFRGWLRGGGSERPPTKEDLTYHLSTLFPPVRPRGHLELRMIDAQPDDGWIVPAAVAWALFEDPQAADAATAAAGPLWAGADGTGHRAAPGAVPRDGTGGSLGNGHHGAASRAGGNGSKASNRAPDGNPWLRAARNGLADPVLARAAKKCFEAANAALSRVDVPAEIRQRVAEFTERYVLRRRCPADDQLEGIH
ncbi:MAG TPA: ergothioneine biosynthesis glutamate--cysteine ligase EgtA [Streptosporangiaceae bacterium]|nr:ergothioneine biosynthesis glutamate--cysteine ligase EgtA [Streptosporangiaceae bacterium]